MTQRKILLIDGSSLAYRAFFSILDIERFKNKAGLHTNALFSFNRMLDGVLDQFKPSHVLVAFDKSGHTFRTEQYPEYKAGRQKTPGEFREQLPYFRVLLDAYGIKYYELLHYEADDILGTLAKAADPDDQVMIVSGDKDLTQLASDQVTVYITKKGVSELEPYTPSSIWDKYQLTPQQIIDLKGLMGDSSDNYPGIERVGEKTALKLLHQFGTVEGLYQGLDQLKPSKMKENIIRDEANARLSKSLARIVQDAPLEITLDDCQLGQRDLAQLSEFYVQMDFRSFLAQLHQGAEVVASQETARYPVTWLESIEDDHVKAAGAFYLETLSENYHFAPVLAVAWTQGEKTYATSGQVAFASSAFRKWLEDGSLPKISADLKRDSILLDHQGLTLAGVTFDVGLAAYLVDVEKIKDLTSLATYLDLGIQVQLDEVVYGKGAKQALPENERLAQHLADKVSLLDQAVAPLTQQLDNLGMTQLYQDMEFPLAQVLTDMEKRGVAVDVATLDQMNDLLLARLEELEAEIQTLAGQAFNPNSPKQFGEILFERLGLPVIKKTKTGYSTAADVLEKLKDAHPIVAALLTYRQLAKLQGTYLAGLPKFIQADGKIHTRFVQTLTQTGRLSSADPNLQNIPIRMEEGRKIRQAFVPSEPGWQLFGADYSQIELRVLAHISGDPHMKQAFLEGQDIHAATSRRVFGLSDDAVVDSDMRRQAKAVNFGIVYGISDYGLSQNLDMSRKEAKAFIDRYLAEYPGISTFMQEIVAQAKKDGYVSTLWGRRRALPDIYSSNFNLRSFAERTAMNTPIQGTAADIIKVAMVALDQAIRQSGLQARLLLQVHDELILEAPQDEIAILEELVPEVMEGAVSLSVPLKVEAASGSNWYQLK